MLQGPSCRLAHCAGVISREAPLLVVSRGGKGDIGEVKKEGQVRGSIVHREDHDGSLASASSQFFFIHAHCLAWSAAVSTFFSSSIVFSSVMTMSLQPLLSLRINHRCRVPPKPVLLVWLASMTSLIWSWLLFLAPL